MYVIGSGGNGRGDGNNGGWGDDDSNLECIWIANNVGEGKCVEDGNNAVRDVHGGFVGSSDAKKSSE